MIKVCETCSINFNVRPSRVGRFCSTRCYGDWKKTQTGKDSTRWVGLNQFTCETCDTPFTKTRESGRRKFCGHKCFVNRDRQALGRKECYVRRTYGLTLEQVDQLEVRQNRLCPISGSPLEGKRDLDHCHKTNKVRGVLSPNANRALGLFNDNRSTLTSAAFYLLSNSVLAEVDVTYRAWRRRSHTRTMVGVWVKQRDNKCDICENDMGRLPHVDHCHTTKQVRGVLCSKCNQGIGLLQDDPEQCLRAKHYLSQGPIN